MERYIWVKQARRNFADILNNAAYGADRIVIQRRGEELAAIVGPADLQFLRRHRPESRYPDQPPREMPLSDEERNLLERYDRIARWLQQAQGSAPDRVPDLTEQLDALTKQLAWHGLAVS